MSVAPRPRPSWQTDECPSWCVVPHHEDDPPDDRVHDSAGSSVPASIRRVQSERDEAVELLVVMSRRCGETQDWVFLGEPERAGQHLVVSRESAMRLSSALDSMLPR